MNKFFSDNRSTGIILFGCAVMSLMLSNSGVSQAYSSFWSQRFSDTELLPVSPLHIINDGLMSIFFFFAALEIKRELIEGELRSIKRSLMPLLCAAGGMVLPALVYLIFCHQPGNRSGWGIPMATDIAFSLAVLSLLGKRIQPAIRIFITAIAIVDDIGGILTIAIFYPTHTDLLYLGLAGGVALLLVALNYFKVGKLVAYLVPGVLLWFFTYNSGVNPSIAGVILAFTIPSSVGQLLIARLHYFVNLGILPLFALANLAIVLPADMGGILTSPVHAGVSLGLVVGKPLGIVLCAIIATRLNVAMLPGKISIPQLLGVGMVAGIGFTVSLFIASIAYTDAGNEVYARIGVITGSLISGLAGYLVLRFASRVGAQKNPE